ncbi:MAG: hypothetical protein AB8B69_00065 [Chitinophagales bacterium]
MEETVFSNDSIVAYLEEYYIIADLYVDEYANAVEKERRVSYYRGEKLSKIGDLNNALQIELFKSGSQPYIVILDENGNSLMNGMYYTSDSKQFLVWLKTGVEKFYSSKPYNQ